MPLDLARVRTTFAQLADAVMAIHGLGKLHRDLKPSNVLVTDDGRVVVLEGPGQGLLNGAGLCVKQPGGG